MCTINKVGSTALAMLRSIVRGRSFTWESPQTSCWQIDDVMWCGEAGTGEREGRRTLASLFADQTWARVVIYRDPLERFVSAFRSKCEQADHDWRSQCDEVFGFGRQANGNRQNITLESVARRLTDPSLRAWTNPHWAPQRSFCGDLLASWPSFTHHLELHSMASGWLEILQGRVPPDVLGRLSASLGLAPVGNGGPSPTRTNRHHTAAAEHTAELSADTRARVRAFYSMDYQMLEHFGVLSS